MCVRRNIPARSLNHGCSGTQQCIVCTVELHVSANSIIIMSVAQKCLNGEFISLATLNVLIS